MLTWVAATALVLLALAAAWLLGMRRKWRPVIDFQRRVNMAVVNPRQLRDAGTPGAYAGVICHTGRRSGREFRTPVVPYRTGDGFAIALPYGTRADWLQNLLATGSAMLEFEGETFAVTDPRVVPIDELDITFTPSDARGHRVVGVTDAVVVRTVGG